MEQATEQTETVISREAKGYQKVWNVALCENQETENALIQVARGYRSISGIEGLIEDYLDRNPREHKRILSLGCGRGEDLHMMAELFPSCELYGIDTSSVVLKNARERIGEASFVCASAGALPFRDDYTFKSKFKFDGIVAAQMFSSNFGREDIEKVFEELDPYTDCNSRMYVSVYGSPEDKDWQSDELFEFGTFLHRTGVWESIHQKQYSMPNISPFARGIFLVAEKKFA